MPRRPSTGHRWLTALTWPVGITLTSWDYMWRTTVMHRREVLEPDPQPHLPPPHPQDVDDAELQGIDRGVGPLFHRRYATTIRRATVDGDTLMRRIKADLNAAAPTEFARFQQVLGDDGASLGDEFVVRMPGPWDGPVRVVADQRRTLRLATLAGHLEAGQIEFRVVDAPPGDAAGDHDRRRLTVEIESWARSGDRFSNLLYHRIHMAKEIQLHMWTSFLEGAVALSGGRMTGGIDIDTRRVELPAA